MTGWGRNINVECFVSSITSDWISINSKIFRNHIRIDICNLFTLFHITSALNYDFLNSCPSRGQPDSKFKAKKNLTENSSKTKFFSWLKEFRGVTPTDLWKTHPDQSSSCLEIGISTKNGRVFRKSDCVTPWLFLKKTFWMSFPELDKKV